MLLGLGIGTGLQQPLVVAQTVLTGKDMALGTSLIIFAQTISGTIFSSVANNIFQSGLVTELSARVPAVDPAIVVAAGANGLVQSMTKIYPQYVGGILAAYAAALQKVWVIPVVLACLSVFGSTLVEWRSVKEKKAAPPKERAEQ